MSKSVAFFDFDGTLTQKDTLLLYLRELSGRKDFYKNLILKSPVLLSYALNLMSNSKAKEQLLIKFLKGTPTSDAYKTGNKVARLITGNLLRPEGIRLLRWHQMNNHDTVIVSASLGFWIEPWSKSNGVNDAICTKIESNDGLITGNLFGNNCYGEEKVRRIRAWTTDKPEYSYSYAYGDSLADLPMLKHVDEGYLLKSGIFERI